MPETYIYTRVTNDAIQELTDAIGLTPTTVSLSGGNELTLTFDNAIATDEKTRLDNYMADFGFVFDRQVSANGPNVLNSVLIDENGNRWRLTINSSGVISTTQVT